MCMLQATNVDPYMARWRKCVMMFCNSTLTTVASVVGADLPGVFDVLGILGVLSVIGVFGVIMWAAFLPDQLPANLRSPCL